VTAHHIHIYGTREQVVTTELSVLGTSDFDKI